MELSLDEELRNAEEDMRNAGEALLMSGFPEDQWDLIRKYTASAIAQSQCILFKTLRAFQSRILTLKVDSKDRELKEWAPALSCINLGHPDGCDCC